LGGLARPPGKELWGPRWRHRLQAPRGQALGGHPGAAPSSYAGNGPEAAYAAGRMPMGSGCSS